MRPAKQFQAEIERIIKRHYPDMMQKDEAVLKLSKGEGWHDLVIEKQGYRMIVDHHYYQNGDIMYSPRMDFVITGGVWYPVYFETAPFPGRESVVYQDGKTYLRPREQREQAAFANQTWAKNLKWQGWIDAEPIKVI